MVAIPDPIEVPLWTDEDGKIRVTGTRLLLELIIHAFNRGESPESIIESYSVLKPADLYAILAYYLNHHAAIDEYVRLVDERSERNQREIEASYSPETLAVRARLREELQRKEP